MHEALTPYEFSSALHQMHTIIAALPLATALAPRDTFRALARHLFTNTLSLSVRLARPRAECGRARRSGVDDQAAAWMTKRRPR